MPFATLIPPPLTTHYLPVTFHHSYHTILVIRLPFLILPLLGTHYLPVIFHHSSHTAPTYTAPTHYSSLITHHGPLTALYTPLITHRSPLIAYSPLPIHDLPLTTHHLPLTTHHPRVCLSYSLTLTARPSPLPLTSPSCHSPPTIRCSLLASRHSTPLRIVTHLNMSDVCRLWARSIKGALRLHPMSRACRVTRSRSPRRAVHIPSLAAPALRSCTRH